MCQIETLLIQRYRFNKLFSVYVDGSFGRVGVRGNGAECGWVEEQDIWEYEGVQG